MNKRILIVGCPGGGKSTFAIRLAEAIGLPLYHLDNLYWRADRTHLSREELIERITPIMQTEAWIMDGNYNATMPLRVSFCDEVIMLDYPLETCLEGIRARCGKPRADMPWVETEPDEEFLAFIRAYPETSRPKVYALMAQHPEKTFTVFHSRADAEAYLAKVRR